MSSSSKSDDPASTQAAAEEVIAESKAVNVESENENENENEDEHALEGSGAQAKKKKSKKKRIKAALGVGSDGVHDGKEGIEKALGGLSKSQIQDLLELNPGLAAQLRENAGASGDLTGASMADQLKRLKVRESFI
jgi:glycylpeptide N-tetradecanoyltransferase